MDTDNKKIIVIDDDQAILNVYQSVLTPPESNGASIDELTRLLNIQNPKVEEDFQIDYASQGKEGYERVADAIESSEPYALAFIDIRMPPGWDGLKTALKIREIDENIEIVIVTAYSDHSVRTIADKIGHTEKLLFLKKPFDPEELTQIARSLTRKWNLFFAEKARRQELETVLMTSPAAIFTIDKDCLVTSWNRAAEQITGYTSAEVIGNSCIIPTLCINPHTCDKCFSGGEIIGAKTPDLLIQNKSGDKRIISKNSSVIRDENGTIVKVIEAFWDITDSKRVQNYIENVINSMPSTIINVDSDNRIINLNEEAERHIGCSLESVKGKKIDKGFPLISPYADDIKKAIETRVPVKKIKDAFHGTDGTHYMDIVIYPLDVQGIRGAVIRIDDITSRVMLEEMVVQSEKMLMAGRFAAGMAHEINSPLSGIMNNLQNAKNRLSLSMPKNLKVAEECNTSLEAVNLYLEKRGIHSMMDSMAEASLRAAETIENMLSFSSKSIANYTAEKINTLLDKTVKIAKIEFGSPGKFKFSDIKIIRDYQEDLPEVVCESSKIQQVILNLLKNASQAMGRQDGLRSPQIILRTVSEGDRVRIEVENNGPFMDENIRKRLFEPFFTTKEVGEGSGLGLFISYFIISEHHNGTMAVESAPGQGVKFIIRIPIQRS